MSRTRTCFRFASAYVACVLFVLSASAQVAPIDFSTAGYAAQARPIPNAPVRLVVSPESGDSTA
ncbi:MAG TPA: hypothetical protein VFZ59_19055, partial [Verrucomicrobiae bacterium]|nr:hypothetical protein [Verrucomicrobiae bacterium]